MKILYINDNELPYIPNAVITVMAGVRDRVKVRVYSSFNLNPIHNLDPWFLCFV